MATRGVRWRRSATAGAIGAVVLAAVGIGPVLFERFIQYRESRPIDCTPMGQEALEKNQPPKTIASPETGGLEEFEYESDFPGLGKIHPSVAIKAFDGWLLGGNEGEFGGAFLYERPGQPQIVLANENVEDIFRMPFGFVATTAYEHLVGPQDSTGRLVLITRHGESAPTARRIQDLPAAASTSWLLENGDLLVNTHNGSVLVGTDASIKIVECESSTRP